MSLFRQEVIDRRKMDVLPRMIPLHQNTHGMFVGVLVIIVAFFTIWMVTGSFSRTEMVKGWVVPNGAMARMVPMQGGTIVSLNVKEGDFVRKGQPLATIQVSTGNTAYADPDAASIDSIDDQRRALAEQMKLAQMTKSSEAARLNGIITQLNNQISSTDAQIGLQGGKVRSSRGTTAIMSSAEKQKYVSKVDLEAQKRSALNEEVALEQLRGQRSQLSRELVQAKADLAQLPITLSNRSVEISSSQSTLDQKRIEIERGRTYVVAATIDGRVSSLQAKMGQSVAAQIPLMYLVAPDATMDAELFAPSKAIGFAKVGEEVRLMYDAFPFQQFGSFKGRISRISPTIQSPNEIDAPVKSEEPVYRIRVALDAQSIKAFGQPIPVQAGMTLSANLVLERQSFLSWLLQPINAVRNRT